MYFTQEDYKKIENWLHRNSVKDTEFQEALPFTGKEIVTVVQDGHNRKVNIQEFINQLYKHGVEDFLNVTNTYRANNITLKEAIRLIPAEARKEGQVITFLNTEGNWEIYQFTGKLNQWNNTTLWNNPFDWEKLVVDSILPDEEDLTKSASDAKGNSYLSLKNRKYEPDKYSGLGRKILRRRVVEIEDPIYGTQEKNLLLQADFAEDNTVYVVRYDFTLHGQDITLPDNSYIEYEGGSISDGNIIDRAGGINRVVLKKNIVNGKNILTQEMINKPNTIYEIRYDFTLDEDVTIPANCVLDFEGGSLKNGTLVGNGTAIKANLVKIFDTDVTFEGSWNVADVYSEWFDWSEQESHTQNMKNLAKLCVSISNTNLFLANRTYYIDGYDSVNNTPYVVKFPSFTHIYNNGTIQIKKSTNSQSFPIALIDVENIIIEGGKINGNVRLLESSPGEQGYGISLRGTKNIVIRDIEIDECFGDAINLQYNNGSTNLLHNTNISISNVVLQRNSRQGISIEDGENIFIDSLTINDTSSILPRFPGAGIDIEPSYTNAVIGSININNCIFSGGKSSIIIQNANISEYGDIRISNCLGDKNLYIAYANSTNAIIYVFNCKFNELYNDAVNTRVVKNAIFENCEFEIKINNQNISDFTFRKCTLNGVNISNSTVDNVVVTDSTVYCNIGGISVTYRNCQIISESASLNNITGYFYNCILEAYNYFRLYGSDGILENCTITNKVSYDADWGIITAGISGANITIRNCDIVPKIAGRYILRGHYNLSTNAVFNIFGGTISPFDKTYMTNPIKATIVYNKGFSAFEETLGKPIYWNGTAWVDATGAAV